MLTIARMGVLAALGLAGCASSAAEIKPAYVSPLQYRDYNCKQVLAEMERVSRRASEVAGVQDTNRSNDAWVTAGAIVLFWPAAFFVKGDGATAQELARLKGEFETLEQVAIEKNCDVQVRQHRPAQGSS